VKTILYGTAKQWRDNRVNLIEKKETVCLNFNKISLLAAELCSVKMALSSQGVCEASAS